ncbi:DsbA family protein [Conexibacter sp. SYSU D00693]|uniref:DsbA family protein n=1 Tax=Conexibacter sp. SYSU D00693 TaxID=2812560 RepID=UPI00196ABB19|nr:DsbA family protein [Conexibacter sp. SYSU D00693]
MADEPLVVQVWSDVACPWCRKGHEQLAEVVAGEPDGSVVVVHRAFELGGDGPSTRLAHRLVKVAAHAAGPAAGTAALEALFAAHLDEGRDVSDPDVAVPLVAAAARLKPEVLRAIADEGAGEQEVAQDVLVAQRIGIDAVPFFLAGERVAVQGAQSAEALRRLLATARERRAVA